MFGLARLLHLAGTISWRPMPRLGMSFDRSRHPVRGALLAVEELEDRVVPTLLGQQLFPVDYPWNQNIANAPVAANSAAVIAHIGGSIGLHPDWGEDSVSNGNDPLYGIPYNVVHGNAPGVPKVNFIIDNYPGESDIVAVPMPANPVIEGDYQNGPNNNGGGYNTNQRGDSHLLIWDADNKIAYELYGVTRPADPTLFPDDNGVEVPHTDGKWHAAQESVWNMNANSFRTLGDTSADAAGLSILAGLGRPDEGRPVGQGGQGAINHALRFTLPSADISPQYLYPASHVVGVSPGSTKLPFGARLRLMNTPAVNAVINGLQPQAQVIAHAMQQYGLVLADIGSAMYITGTSAAQDTNNNISLTWNMDDVLGLRNLTAGYFEVVNLAPVVTGLSTAGGSTGTAVTIIGQNFSGAAGHLSVLFGSVAATSVTFVDDSHITAVVPNGSGIVHVRVQSGVNATDPNNPIHNVTNPIFGYGTSAATAADQFTFSGQTVSGANSSASFATSSVASSLTDTLTLAVQDTSGAAVPGLTNNAFTFGLSGGTSAGTFGAVTATATPGTYTATFTGTTAGTVSTLTITINGVTLTNKPTITVTVGSVSAVTSTVSFASPTVGQGGTNNVTIRAKDGAGNAITGLANSAFSFSLSGGSSAGTFGAVTETATNGTYTAVFTATAAGTASTLTATINGVSLNTKPTVTVNPPPASLPFTDSFTGAQLSGYWQTHAGSIAIVNGNATGQGAANLATLIGINQANVSVQATVNVSAGQFAGLVARHQGPADRNMYVGVVVSSGSGYVAEIYVNNNGVWTLLASSPIGGLGQGTLLFTAIGSTLQLFWQPTGTSGFALAASAVNSSLTTGSVGIRAGAGASLDNFAAAAATTVTAQNASLPFTENFASANYPSGLGSQLSSFWRNQAGNISIVNGSATGQSPSNLATLNGINQANVSVQAVVNVAPGQFAGLVTRYQGTANQNMYFGAIVSNGAGYTADIYVNNNGVWTQLATSSVGAVGQGTLLFRAIGSALQLFWQPTGTNGFTLAASAMNSSLMSGSVGIRAGSGGSLANFTAAVAATVQPQNASLPFTENFGASNYPSGPGSQLSSFWQNQAGNISIVNGQATGASAANLATLNGVNQANVAVQAVVNLAPGQFAGLVARCQGTAEQNMYLGVIAPSGAGFVGQIYVNINGAWTLLSSNSIGNVGQGTLLFTAIGSSLKLYWQPTGTSGFRMVASAMNSTLTSGSVGIRAGAGAKLASFNAALTTPVQPQNAALPFTENFANANYPSGLGSALSSYWQNQAGNISIINSSAAGSLAVNMATLNGVNQANVSVQADVNIAPGQFAGLVARYQGTADQNLYLAVVESSGSGFVAEIYVNIGGVWTLLTPQKSIGTAGQGTLLFTAVGSSLQLFWNGVLVVSGTDTRFASGSVGMRVSQSAAISNFQATAS